MSTKRKTAQDWYREEKARARSGATRTPHADAMEQAKREFAQLLRNEAEARKGGRPRKTAAEAPQAAPPAPPPPSPPAARKRAGRAAAPAKNRRDGR